MTLVARLTLLHHQARPTSAAPLPPAEVEEEQNRPGHVGCGRCLRHWSPEAITCAEHHCQHKLFRCAAHVCSASEPAAKMLSGRGLTVPATAAATNNHLSALES